MAISAEAKAIWSLGGHGRAREADNEEKEEREFLALGAFVTYKTARGVSSLALAPPEDDRCGFQWIAGDSQLLG